MDSNKTKHLKGLDYFLSIFYYYNREKFNRYALKPNQKNLIKCLLYFNSEKISKETLMERLFWDLAGIIEDTDVIEDICCKIESVIPSKKKPSNSEKNVTHPPKTDNFDKKTDIKTHNFQYSITFWDNGKSKFDTLSSDLREGLRNYRRDVHYLLKVRYYYFHNLQLDLEFIAGYLEILKKSIKLTKFDFISLRFCNNKLTVTFNRDINKRISCKGFVLDILRDFIAIGIRELFVVLANHSIAKEEFIGNIRAESYTQLHLAKDINRNIKTKQPELYNRLRLNQDNDMESLSYIGLNHYYHYIDFSRKDDFGYKIPEYEIQFRKQSGISFSQLEQNLLLLEPNIIPKQQTIYSYLDNNSKYYNTIPEFIIKDTNQNPLSLEYIINNETKDYEKLATTSSTNIKPTKLLSKNS